MSLNYETRHNPTQHRYGALESRGDEMHAFRAPYQRAVGAYALKHPELKSARYHGSAPPTAAAPGQAPTTGSSSQVPRHAPGEFRSASGATAVQGTGQVQGKRAMPPVTSVSASEMAALRRANVRVGGDPNERFDFPVVSSMQVGWHAKDGPKQKLHAPRRGSAITASAFRGAHRD